MTIKELLIEGSNKLKEEKIEEPILSVRILLSFLLNKPKEYLVINDKEEVEEEILKKFEENILKLINGVPIQYITNKQEFMKLNFYVNESVLIPRADTEILVEEVINICKNMKKDEIKILDLCTGSGAIAISLAKYVENVNIYASDISKNALEVAEKNARKNNVKVDFIESNLFENIEEKFDIIVSNPPYIRTDEILILEKNVQNEPKIALDGGEDGLMFYKKITEESINYLNKNGYLCFEIGFDQKKQVEEIAQKYYNKIYSKKDLSENDRIVVAQM